MSARVPSLEEFEQLAARVAELEERLAETQAAPHSPYMTVKEAAEYLRCSRQRVDNLLSQRRLERMKDGARTLIRRSDLDAHLANGAANGKRTR
ncbi:MAG: helix-turn-helix domain-containing protein [Gaiellaceae bacterium]